MAAAGPDMGLQSTKVVILEGDPILAAVTLETGESAENEADILAGLHEVVSARVLALLNRVGIEEKFVITGGIGKNVGVVTKLGEKLDGIKIIIPAEPQIAGAVGAALFAFDRAIASFSMAYADQNESDHATLERAVRQGKVQAVFEEVQ